MGERREVKEHITCQIVTSAGISPSKSVKKLPTTTNFIIISFDLAGQSGRIVMIFDRKLFQIRVFWQPFSWHPYLSISPLPPRWAWPKSPLCVAPRKGGREGGREGGGEAHRTPLGCDV